MLPLTTPLALYPAPPLALSSLQRVASPALVAVGPQRALRATQTSGVPVDERALAEWMRMMDLTRQGSITFREFGAFFANEIADGKVRRPAGSQRSCMR